MACPIASGAWRAATHHRPAGRDGAACDAIVGGVARMFHDVGEAA